MILRILWLVVDGQYLLGRGLSGDGRSPSADSPRGGEISWPSVGRLSENWNVSGVGVTFMVSLLRGMLSSLEDADLWWYRFLDDGPGFEEPWI